MRQGEGVIYEHLKHNEENRERDKSAAEYVEIPCSYVINQYSYRTYNECRSGNNGHGKG